MKHEQSRFKGSGETKIFLSKYFSLNVLKPCLTQLHHSIWIFSVRSALCRSVIVHVNGRVGIGDLRWREHEKLDSMWASRSRKEGASKASSAIKISQFHKALHAEHSSDKEIFIVRVAAQFKLTGDLSSFGSVVFRSRAQHDYAKAVFGTTCTLPRGEPLDILRWKNEFSFYVFIHIAHLYQWRSRPVMPTRIFPQSTDKPAE